MYYLDGIVDDNLLVLFYYLFGNYCFYSKFVIPHRSSGGRRWRGGGRQRYSGGQRWQWVVVVGPFYLKFLRVL